MAKYRKKPVEVEAVLVRDVLNAVATSWADLPDWIVQAYERGDLLLMPTAVIVDTLEGRMRGELDDLLIQGIKKEIYPCKPEVFEASHELVG